MLGSSPWADTRCAGFMPNGWCTSSPPPTTTQRDPGRATDDLVVHRQLKDYKSAADPQRATELSARFERIFKRRTGYATLDRILKRLLARKRELLRALERPEIALNTNASENDIRACVTKRKISGGTVSEKAAALAHHARPRQKDVLETPNSCSSTTWLLLGLPGTQISRPRKTSSLPMQQRHLLAREFAPVTTFRLRQLMCLRQHPPFCASWASRQRH